MAHPKCSPYDALQMCAGRRDAVKRGDFLYDPALGGYVWVAFGDAIEQYEAWLSCPWCHEPLPSADIIETSSLDLEED